MTMKVPSARSTAANVTAHLHRRDLLKVYRVRRKGRCRSAMGPSSAPHAAHRPRWRIRQTLAGFKDAADYVTKSGPSSAVIAIL